MRKSLIFAAALWICGLGPPAISAEAVPKSGSVQTHAAFYFAAALAWLAIHPNETPTEPKTA